ncbi:MAG TPA: metal-dependent hydrolase [Pedobacter sp.]|nr:metal-dependent hydrolase [Pedobacter sp.]
MKITYYGHSCFAITIGGAEILFDPFISGNEMARHIDLDKIKADYIFISHAHFDHILDAVKLAGNTKATVIGNWEIKDWLVKQGVEHTHPMNPGGQWQFPFGMVKCVTAQHSSSFPDGSYGGSACGFIFRTDEGSFYYSGDTALTLDMQLIGKWAHPDLAILPIGDALTMGADDAIEACNMLGIRNVLGVHYDTFGYIKIDREEVTQKFSDKGINLLLPAIGESIDFKP